MGPVCIMAAAAIVGVIRLAVSVKAWGARRGRERWRAMARCAWPSVRGGGWRRAPRASHTALDLSSLIPSTGWSPSVRHHPTPSPGEARRLLATATRSASRRGAAGHLLNGSPWEARESPCA